MARVMGDSQPFTGRSPTASVQLEPGVGLRWRCLLKRTVQDVMTRDAVAVRGATPSKS